MSKRVAALDLGTNTFHLLIADVSAKGVEKIVHSEQRHCKLGEGGISTGIITEASFQRGIEALKDFKTSIIDHQVKEVRAVGTAALRAAANGTDFIRKAEKETGIRVRIIDGEKEAGLIFKGVKQALDLNQCSLIMDIGGGSVEFIIADSDQILWKKSFPIGAAKLMALFHHSDPISDKDITDIHNHLGGILAELKMAGEEFEPKVMIGSAGAFETFAALCQIKARGYEEVIKSSFIFNVEQLKAVLSDILDSTHDQRVNNSAILSVRTDMIVVASVLTQYILEKLNITGVKLSTFALKEGLLFDSSDSW